MKRLTKAGILAVGAALVSQVAQAQFVANDLYLGFSQSSAAGDYLLNLGAASSIVGQSSVVDLSGILSLSTFNSIFTGGASGVSMGVVSGLNTFPSSLNDLYMTAPIGTDLSSINLPASAIGFAEGSLTRITTFPLAGTGVEDTGKLWSANVPTGGAGDFFGASGVNPDTAIGGTGILEEGLWEATPNNAADYLGYFTLDTTGGSPSLSFTSIQAVPEPGVVSILYGGAALLWVLRFRNGFGRKENSMGKI